MLGPVNSLGADLMPIPNVTSPQFPGVGADILGIDPALLAQVAGYQQPMPTAQAAPFVPGVPPKAATDPRDRFGRGQRRPGEGRFPDGMGGEGEFPRDHQFPDRDQIFSRSGRLRDIGDVNARRRREY